MSQLAGGNAPAYDFSCIEPLADSPLQGGHIAVLGSSVARGEASEGWAVGEYLAARLGTQLTKEAVSGTTLADTGPQSYVRRLYRLDPNARYDLFLCQLSTNDATLHLPQGVVASGRDPAQFDRATTLGALETILEYALRTWRCPAAVFTGSRYDSKDYAALVACLPALRQKWGIGVLDLWNSEPFNGIPDASRRLYMRDPIHPTKAGYRDWWGPELERQLLAFLNR